MKGYFDELTKNGKADKEAFRQYLLKVYLTDNNVFDYMNDSEIAMLNARWPAEYWKNEENDEATSKKFLGLLEGVRPECIWRVFANLSKSIALIRYGRARLYKEEYEETIRIYTDAIIRYVFGE